jgi:hypothetical protein
MIQLEVVCGEYGQTPTIRERSDAQEIVGKVLISKNVSWNGDRFDGENPSTYGLQQLPVRRSKDSIWFLVLA